MADKNVGVIRDARNAEDRINEEYRKSGLEHYMTAGTRSNASAKQHAEQLVSSGFKNRGVNSAKQAQDRMRKTIGPRP